jgi:hypothetical protein
VRRPRPVVVKPEIDPLDPTYLQPGTLVEFRAIFAIPSQLRDDGGELRRIPRPGFAYVVRGQFRSGFVDIEERVACRSRPKVGMPKGSAVSVVMNVPIAWVLIREVTRGEAEPLAG